MPFSLANRLPKHRLPTILGFTAQSSSTQRDWEQKFKAIPDPKNMRDYMQRLSARPHHVGSPYDKENAEWMLAQIPVRGAGTRKIEHFDVLFPTPKDAHARDDRAHERFTAKLNEPALADDTTSGRNDEQLPTYNAYSPDGDVTAAARLRELRPAARTTKSSTRLGVSVKGAMVIAKYGDSWRGVKPRVACGTRRNRLPHLFRSRKTTVTSKNARCSQRADSGPRTAFSVAA